MTSAVPLREGLFREGADGPTLLASQCAACERVSYPATEQCLKCGNQTTKSIELGGEGALLVATVVHMGNGRFDAGYSVGYVTMPHGVRVFSQLDASADNLPAPGTRMRLEVLPMWREGEQDVLAYRFTSAARKESAHA